MTCLNSKSVDANSRENTWKEEYPYTSDMRKRCRRLLNMIEGKFKSVMDVGCGNQQLRSLLRWRKPFVKYYGSDYLQVKATTIICDFNKGEFPDIYVDLCFLSGILEYIYPDMLDCFIQNVCTHCSSLAVSYCFSTPPPPTSRTRLSFNWVNDITFNEMLILFLKNNFSLVRCEIYHNNQQYQQYLFVFVKRVVR
jgi:hypothetical protein